MFVRSFDDSPNAGDKKIPASQEGRSFLSSYSMEEKFTAFTAIALGVVGFSIFLLFYCAPLIRAQRNAKAAKKRHDLLQPFAPTQRRPDGRDDSYSLCSTDSNESELLVPGRVIPKDSVGLTKARQSVDPDHLDPFYRRFPPLANDSWDATYKRPQHSYGLVSPRSSSYTSTSRKGLRTAPKDSSIGDLSESSSTTFAISDFQDCIANAGITGSPPEYSLLQAPNNTAVSDANPSSSPSANRICGMIPPRTSSLNAILSSSVLETSDINPKPTPHERQMTKDEMQPLSPAYVEVILPRHLRERYKTSSGLQDFCLHEFRMKADGEYAKIPVIAVTDADSVRTDSKVQSLQVQETVLARASSYTRGLVSGSPPKPRLTGTELQFEMVKGKSQAIP